MRTLQGIINELRGNDLPYGDLIVEALQKIADRIDEEPHETEPGWCCACGADIAFAESWLRETKPEIFKDATRG